MDLVEYFRNVRSEEKLLDQKHPNRVVYITSVKNSAKNSLAGMTVSATPYNAARAITDETHREASDTEIKLFLEHQERNRLDTQRSETRKKKEIVVVMDRGQAAGFPEGSRELVESAMASRSSRNSDDD